MINISSKNELSKELKEKVIQKLLSMKLVKQSEEIKFSVDPAIISGIRIDNESEVIDLTINNRLEKIFEALG